MITYKPIIAPNSRRKDGTYPVKIRVTFKGVVRRLPTTLVCYQQDITRSFKIKNATIIDKANELIKRMRSATDELSPFDLEAHNVDWVVTRIKEALTKESFRLDFFAFGERYVESKSPTTRNAYTCAMNTFARFLGERSIDINDITRTMLLDFVDFVEKEPKMHYDTNTGEMVASTKTKMSRGASSRHLMKLANIYNTAKDRYNDEDSGRIVIPRSPFSNIDKVFPPSQGQKNLGVEMIQRIISEQTDDSSIRLALDAFILSFGLMGANLADLYNATPVGEVWTYNRIKTATRRADKAEMKVTVPPEMRPYIGRLQEGVPGWWLPALHRIGKTKDIATAKINAGLRKWCELNGIPVFTFYASRHSWSSIARNNARIEKALIDDCLCHKGDFAMADIYIEKDYTLMNEANRKVLDLFEW